MYTFFSGILFFFVTEFFGIFVFFFDLVKNYHEML